MLRTIYEHYTHTFMKIHLKKETSQHRTYNIFLYKQIIVSQLLPMLFSKREFKIKSQTFCNARWYASCIYMLNTLLKSDFPNSTSFPFRYSYSHEYSKVNSYSWGENALKAKIYI